jgi:site-specific recombinase XerC
MHYVMSFLTHCKERVNQKELSAGSIQTYVAAIRLFCEIHNLNTINWKRITKSLPKAVMAANDRAPTVEEIRKLLEYSDRRLKALILVMCSSGLRVGGWDSLKWAHVKPVEREGSVVAGRLVVYPGEREEYYTFCSLEAYNALLEWMNYRKEHGENITGDSWVMRNLWRTSDIKHQKGGKYGLATIPKRLDSATIKKMIVRTLYRQNLRYALPEGKRRHEFKALHGFRKYFQTNADRIMNHLNVELLQGHKLGLTGSYYKPREDDVLTDYLKAIPLLSINDDNSITIKTKEDNKQRIEEIKKDSQNLHDELESTMKRMLEMKKEWQESRELEDKLNAKRDKLIKEILEFRDKEESKKEKGIRTKNPRKRL